jgi:hypothetical protein
LRASDDLERLFTLQLSRKVTKNLTVNYKRVLYVLDKTDAAGAARGRRLDVEEQEDGTITFRYDGVELAATAFPRDDGMRQGDIVDNKRLAAVLELIKADQRARTEARIAEVGTTRRSARLLREGVRRRTSAEESP